MKIGVCHFNKQESGMFYGISKGDVPFTLRSLDGVELPELSIENLKDVQDWLEYEYREATEPQCYKRI